MFRTEYINPTRPLPATGEPLDEAFLRSLEEAREAFEAEKKGMELLARAEHTRRLLELKLLRRDMPDKAVRAALDYLESRGFLDDARYAYAWTDERIRGRGEGPFRLLAGLLRRGVSQELARSAIQQALSGPDREEALRRAVERLLKGGRRDEESAIRKLREEGWKPSEIADALEAFRNGSD